MGSQWQHAARSHAGRAARHDVRGRDVERVGSRLPPQPAVRLRCALPRVPVLDGGGGPRLRRPRCHRGQAVHQAAAGRRPYAHDSPAAARRGPRRARRRARARRRRRGRPVPRRARGRRGTRHRGRVEEPAARVPAASAPRLRRRRAAPRARQPCRFVLVAARGASPRGDTPRVVHPAVPAIAQRGDVDARQRRVRGVAARQRAAAVRPLRGPRRPPARDARDDRGAHRDHRPRRAVPRRRHGRARTAAPGGRQPHALRPRRGRVEGRRGVARPPDAGRRHRAHRATAPALRLPVAMTATDTARTAPEPSVLALVLTYSAPRALVTCIRALVGQTRPPDAVVVVDNAGTPPAYDTLAAAGLAGGTVTVLRLEENTGPAGGHAEGLARFLASGHDFVWIMDDDCEPAVDCLRALLDDTHGTTTGQYLVPTWGDREGERIAHPAWWGPLLSRDVVERAGLPRAELFWWAEDTEYLLWRIPDLGYERRHCAGATVHHSRARGSARRPAWKYYYEARNSLYLRFRLRRRPWKAIRAVLRLCAAIVLWEDHKVSKLAALGRGVVDAVAGRLGRRMVPPPASTAPATGTVLHLLPVD